MEGVRHATEEGVLEVKEKDEEGLAYKTEPEPGGVKGERADGTPGCNE